MQPKPISYELEPVNEPSFDRCLLIESCIPIRLDLELVLRRYFEHHLKRIVLASETKDGVFIPLHNSYRLVVLSGVILSQLQWTLPPAHSNNKPLVIALVDESQAKASHLGVDYYLPSNTTALQFETCLEELLEVQNILNRYPWLSINKELGQPLEMLHRSEGAVLFRVEAKQTDHVVKHFKLDTQLLAPHHFDSFLALVAKLKALRHEGVVRIVDAQASTSGVYVVMEYVDGITLKDWLWDEPLPDLKLRLQWYKGIVEAVGVLHEAGIVHGDLKSSNIIIRADNQPVLLDFGLDGQLLREAGALGESEIYGTPYYVSPELIMGDPLDHQADLYALGILFYEMLTGQKPYQGGSLDLILRKHMLAPIPKLPDSLVLFQPLLQKLMAKIPESRFPSAQQMLQALDEVTLQL